MHEALFTVFSCRQVGAVEFCQLSPGFPLGASYRSCAVSFAMRDLWRIWPTYLKLITTCLKARFFS